MLNLKPPESSSVCDPPVERSKRPRDDSDPWNVAWPPDTHRRLEVLGYNKVVINWINVAWEVKGEEYAVPVRGVVDQFVRWFLGGTFRPRTDDNDWCRHILRGSNKAADTHANWLMDRHIVLSFGGTRRRSGLGAAAWSLWLRNEYGTFEKVSNGGCVLRNASAMIAEREALKMGIEPLTVLFPTEVSSFNFQVECTDRTVQYKLNAQSLRLFGLHRDVNDAHRAGANRLQNKKNVRHTVLDVCPPHSFKRHSSGSWWLAAGVAATFRESQSTVEGSAFSDGALDPVTRDRHPWRPSRWTATRTGQCSDPTLRVRMQVEQVVCRSGHSGEGNKLAQTCNWRRGCPRVAEWS